MQISLSHLPLFLVCEWKRYRSQRLSKAVCKEFRGACVRGGWDFVFFLNTLFLLHENLEDCIFECVLLSIILEIYERKIIYFLGSLLVSRILLYIPHFLLYLKRKLLQSLFNCKVRNYFLNNNFSSLELT